MNGCCCLVKYLLILINFVFWAAGIAAFAIFGWLLMDKSFLISLTQDENHYYIGLYIIIGVAALTLIIAFLGCCGALKESQCLLVTFFCFLLIVLVAEVATGVWAVYNKDRLDGMVRSAVERTVKSEYGVADDKTRAFDVFQQHLKCCGAQGPIDWATSKYNENATRGVSTEPGHKEYFDVSVTNKKTFFYVPASCCSSDFARDVCNSSLKIEYGVSKITKHPMIYEKGCVEALIEQIHKYLTIIISVIIGIVTVEIFALLISLCLCCSISDKEDHYKS